MPNTSKSTIITGNNYQQQITELEIKIAFQDKTLEELNQVVISQQILLDKLQAQIRYLANKLADISPKNIAYLSEETPPPHY